MHAILTQLTSLPAEVWQMLLAGALAPPLVQVLKKWLNAEKHWVELILLFLAIVASLLVYAYNTTPLLQNWFASILLQTGLVGLSAKPVYYIFIKGLWQGVLGPQLSEMGKMKSELKSAAIPAGGLPLESDLQSAQEALHKSLTVEDFSN